LWVVPKTLLKFLTLHHGADSVVVPVFNPLAPEFFF
jgi:hypothetical protein